MLLLRRCVSFGVLALLGACSTTPPAVNNTINTITALCAEALPLAPAVPVVGVYVTAACGTEEAIAAIAKDPTTVAWLQGLIGKMHAALG